MEKKKWKDCDGQEKALRVIGYVLLALSGIFTATTIFGRLFIPQYLPFLNDFYASVDIFTAAQTFNVWLRSLSYIVCILFISYIARLLLDVCFCWLKRGRSIISLLCSFIKYVAVVVIIFLILAAFGVDTNALIAGIGVLSLIVGLAIQPLLQDIIAGIFIVFEKNYDVGDVVVVDTFRGTVVEIGIRTTKIKDAGGDIKVINNSDIRTLVNMTSELSLAVCDVEIEYSESLERVEKVIEQNLPVIREKIPAIVDGPYYKGVALLGANGITLRLVAQCPEDCKFQTQRDMNRQMKLIFDANDIGIPYPQVVVHEAKETPTPAPSTGATDEFVREQNERSHALGEDDEK